jgi:hypothetical protein
MSSAVQNIRITITLQDKNDKPSADDSRLCTPGKIRTGTDRSYRVQVRKPEASGKPALL